MSAYPVIEITHVKTCGCEVTEVGAVVAGRLIWRMPVQAVFALYRLGVRFFAKRDNRAVEVLVDPGNLTREPRLRTPADRVVEPFLVALPQLPA